MTFRAIEINKSIYDKAVDSSQETIKKSQVNIKLFLPPSDVPQYISPNYDANKDIFCINFKYPDQEKEKKIFNTIEADLIIGEESGKPIRIEIKNVKAHNINTIALTNIIGQDIPQLIQQHLNKIKDLREKSNLINTQAVLVEKAQEIAKEMELVGA